MCVGVDTVVRLANTSAYEFEERYAYSTAPVIVTDATLGWKATKVPDNTGALTVEKDGTYTTPSFLYWS
jgi:hypothetical protein